MSKNTDNTDIVNRVNVLSVAFKFLQLTFSAHKTYYIVLVFATIINSLQIIYNLYMISIVISFLDKGTFDGIMSVVITIALVNVILGFLSKLSEALLTVHQAKTEEALNHRVFEKTTTISYQNLEDPEFLDLIEKAKFSINNEDCINTLLSSISNVFQSTSVLLGIVSILWSFNASLLIILTVVFVINLILVRIFSKIRINYFNENVEVNRKFSYYIRVLVDHRYGKDFRMYPIGNFLRSKFSFFTEKMCKNYNTYLKKNLCLRTLIQMIKHIELIVIYCIIIIKVLYENLSIANFSLYITTAINFSSATTKLINGCMGLYIGIQLVAPLIRLMDIEEEKDLSEKIQLSNTIETIEFKNVTFKYPKSNITVLHNVSFKINKGEKICIIGLNGAGKTTLVKLLCQLYKPTSGDILVNGISIYEYQYSSYVKRISSLFQDFKLFAYSLRDNIETISIGQANIDSLINDVGLKKKVSELPKGLDSLYTKSFDEDGIELSGGETQKIALARALAKKPDLIVLDEPTSAFDPISESEFYERLKSLTRYCTTIYISHRMSSAIFCDKILVIEDGRISNFDTHSELIKNRQGLYYKLFMSQANSYI